MRKKYSTSQHTGTTSSSFVHKSVIIIIIIMINSLQRTSHWQQCNKRGDTNKPEGWYNYQTFCHLYWTFWDIQSIYKIPIFSKQSVQHCKYLVLQWQQLTVETVDNNYAYDTTVTQLKRTLITEKEHALTDGSVCLGHRKVDSTSTKMRKHVLTGCHLFEINQMLTCCFWQDSKTCLIQI